MATKIADFFPGTTKKFSIVCSINNVVQNITLDTVTVKLKAKRADTDANAVLTVNADVATSGSTGIALFTLTPTLTKVLTPKKYFIDIEWVRSTGEEYIVYDSTIVIKQRLSDVPV